MPAFVSAIDAERERRARRKYRNRLGEAAAHANDDEYHELVHLARAERLGLVTLEVATEVIVGLLRTQAALRLEAQMCLSPTGVEGGRRVESLAGAGADPHGQHFPSPRSETAAQDHSTGPDHGAATPGPGGEAPSDLPSTTAAESRGERP